MERLRALAELSARALAGDHQLLEPKAGKPEDHASGSKREPRCGCWKARTSWPATAGRCEGPPSSRITFRWAKDDVHLFDFHVFPRVSRPWTESVPGQQHSWRAYDENAEAGHLLRRRNGMRHSYPLFAKLRSRSSGVVRSFTIFGHTFVSWAGGQDGAVDVRSANSADHMLEIAGSNKQ